MKVKALRRLRAELTQGSWVVYGQNSNDIEYRRSREFSGIIPPSYQAEVPIEIGEEVIIETRRDGTYRGRVEVFNVHETGEYRSFDLQLRDDARRIDWIVQYPYNNADDLRVESWAEVALDTLEQAGLLDFQMGVEFDVRVELLRSLLDMRINGALP